MPDPSNPLVFALMGLQFVLYALAWWAYAAISRETHIPTRYLGMFNILVGLGMLLAWSRDESRGWAAYVGADLCFIAAFIAVWRGLAQFTADTPRTRLQLGVLTVTAAMLLYAGPGTEQAMLRVFGAFAGCAVIVTIATLQIGPLLRREFNWKWSRLVRLACVVTVLLLGWRGVDQLLHPELRMELNNSQSAPSTVLLLGVLIAAALFNFSILGLLLLRYIRQLHRLTHHDPLTGLLNRRAFDEATEREWLRRKREPAPLAVAAFDLDHFKRVNDTHGHAVGDLVLMHTALLLRTLSREIDLVARLGGEEFVIVMPVTSEREALAAAERLRKALAAEAAPIPGGTLQVTTSIGVAMAEPGDESVHDTLRRADAALYQAKKEGRNRVCSAMLPQVDFVSSI